PSPRRTDMSTANLNPEPEREENPTIELDATAPTAQPAMNQAAPTVWPSESDRELRLRPGTMIWGVLVTLFGAAVVAWGQDLRFDVQLAAIGVLAAAGVLLVVSSLVRGKRQSERL